MTLCKVDVPSCIYFSHKMISNPVLANTYSSPTARQLFKLYIAMAFNDSIINIVIL